VLLTVINLIISYYTQQGWHTSKVSPEAFTVKQLGITFLG